MYQPNAELRKKYLPVLLFGIIVLAVNFFTRLLLFIWSFNQLDAGFKNTAGIFLIGFFYDLCFLFYAAVPLLLLLWLTGDRIYQRPAQWIVIPVFVLLVAGNTFFNLIPKVLRGSFPKYVSALFILLALIYFFLLGRNRMFRIKWRIGAFYLFFYLYIFLLLFNAISEFFFWREFGARYNFIAVDYLFYTYEVTGNIRQSYPVVWIISAVALIALAIVLPVCKYLKNSVYASVPFGRRTFLTAVMLIFPVLTYLFVTDFFKNFSNNNYVNELAGNGIYEFGAAYRNNDLDFYHFYKSIPDKESLAEVRKQILQRSPTDKFIYDDSLSVEREVTCPGPEKKMNVVLISVESLSASFMHYFGNTENLTPNLDSLAMHSIFFTDFFAAGTRTADCLEAISLAIPPISGPSIIKRTGNKDLFTLGSVFRLKGYNALVLHGGYSHFDNMGNYFRNNGYEVFDRSNLHAAEIHHENIWGVADEDLFTFSLKKFDENYQLQKPFFAQILTVSNHSPYSYPENRIDISPGKNSRAGAIKYTDYAIGRFIREASSKPWFANTLFIIAADHCAYAAGKSDLPVTGYHIPLLIYGPGNIQPQIITRLCSQIDLAPTILGLLNMSYRSKFFGQDIFRMPAGTERAFISTYQGLGYIRDGQLIIQKPPKKTEQLVPDFETGAARPAELTDSLSRQAVSYYQLAEKIYKSGGYKINLAH